MDSYSCFDGRVEIIDRCQIDQDLNVLKKMGKPLFEVHKMKDEEAVVCSLNGSTSDFHMDY